MSKTRRAETVAVESPPHPWPMPLSEPDVMHWEATALPLYPYGLSLPLPSSYLHHRTGCDRVKRLLESMELSSRLLQGVLHHLPETGQGHAAMGHLWRQTEIREGPGTGRAAGGAGRAERNGARRKGARKQENRPGHRRYISHLGSKLPLSSFEPPSLGRTITHGALGVAPAQQSSP